MPAAPSTLVRPLAESRPPGLTWRPAEPGVVAVDQPRLELEPADPDVGQPRAAGLGVEVTVLRSRWCARPSPRLPDAQGWSVTLAQALLEALHALRPVAQLNRWVADDVLAGIALHQRRRRREAGPVTTPPVLRSVRLQHPHPEVTEVATHLALGRRSTAMAFRLEACGDRWLCTVLELGPRPQ